MQFSSPLARHKLGRFRDALAAGALPAVGLAVLILLFFNKMALSQLILARGDTLLYFYPYWQAASDALRAGRLPLWNPNLFMGAPMLANSQMGFFYPLNWPLWLFLSAPYAVSASILLHLFIAGWGMFLAARSALGLGKIAAFLSGVLFALGGYLTAQVEHVNQLQGLAWIPYYLILLEGGRGSAPERPRLVKKILPLSLLFALQLLAGHSQTSFVTATGLLLWMAGKWLFARLSRDHLVGSGLDTPATYPVRNNLLAIFCGALLALAIAAVQLMPTVELAQLSARQGGLPPNEVLSFSLSPLLLGRALLPHYGQGLFTEYLASMPVAALILAILGGWQWRRRQGALPALLFALVGLLLATGMYQPINWLLARAPLFNLFRVPARWLVLYALGTSLLAGLGWQQLSETWRSSHVGQKQRRRQAPGTPWLSRRATLAAFLLPIALMGWAMLTKVIAPMFPILPEAPFEATNRLTIMGWMLELLLVGGVVAWHKSGHSLPAKRFTLARPITTRLPLMLLASNLLVMFLLSREHPYNNLTAPEAFFDLRPAVARLQAIAACVVPDRPCSQPPERFLSLSGIFFDPGDQAEVDTIYAQQLPLAAQYDLTIASKQKEIIAPNLPLAFDLHAVDGFDGGILPLRAYNQAMTLILPEGSATGDGRLREYLDQLPEARWLDLFNARYLITDKVADVWKQGVFFDRQFPATITDGKEYTVGHVPAFEATALLLLASSQPAPVLVTSPTGETWHLAFDPLEEDLYRASFPTPVQPRMISLTSWPDRSLDYMAQGVTLVDDRDGAFTPLLLGEYRLIHSGDVKIYENLDVLPRAFLVHDYQWEANNEAIIANMRSPTFDPHFKAVLLGEGRPGSVDEELVPKGENVSLQLYEPERVVIGVDNGSEAVLVLTDAFYPGWSATIGGEPAEIYQVDGMFRGLRLPAGRHEIIFTYRPTIVQVGLALSAAGVLLWLLLAIRSARRAQRPLTSVARSFRGA